MAGSQDTQKEIPTSTMNHDGSQPGTQPSSRRSSIATAPAFDPDDSPSIPVQTGGPTPLEDITNDQGGAKDPESTESVKEAEVQPVVKVRFGVPMIEVLYTDTLPEELFKEEASFCVFFIRR